MMYEADNDTRQMELTAALNRELFSHYVDGAAYVNGDSMLHTWLLFNERSRDRRLDAHEKSLDAHDKRIKQLEAQFVKSQGQAYDPGEKSTKKLVSPEKSQNPENSLLRHYEKLSTYINSLRGRECIDDQFQHTTPVLSEIDKIFALYSEESDRFRRQLILKLRSAVKLNRLDQLFTDAQIDLLVTIVERLQLPAVEKSDVLGCLNELMDCDLSPFPTLEEDQRENEAFSGHDDTD